MEEGFFQSPKKKFSVIDTILILAAISIIISIAALILFSSGKPESELSLGKAAECPEDYCMHWVYGSCSGVGERYKERTCFDYPESGGCEQGKMIYYEKSSEGDESCA